MVLLPPFAVLGLRLEGIDVANIVEAAGRGIFTVPADHLGSRWRAIRTAKLGIILRAWWWQADFSGKSRCDEKGKNEADLFAHHEAKHLTEYGISENRL